MAIRCCSPSVIMPRAQTNKSKARVSMLQNSQPQPRRATTTGSSNVYMLNKVFEDQLRGIVCYRDHNGELVCEGLDEGPRFNQQSSQSVCNIKHKDVSIPSLLHQRWSQIMEEIDFHCVKGITRGELN